MVTLSPSYSDRRPKHATCVITTDAAFVLIWSAAQHLWADRLMEDEAHCVASAIEIRHELTRELQQSTLSAGMTQCLKAIRVACREFVDAAGPMDATSGTRTAAKPTPSPWPWGG